MKQLNIIEAMKMPIGTEFEVHYDDGGKATGNMILKTGDKGTKYLDWVDGNIPLRVFAFLADTTFIPIQQPISFMEVVNSGRRCKVEHEYVEDIRKINDLKFVYEHEFKKGDYMPLNYLVYVLGYNCSQENIQEIINNGKWYLEE